MFERTQFANQCICVAKRFPAPHSCISIYLSRKPSQYSLLNCNTKRHPMTHSITSSRTFGVDARIPSNRIGPICVYYLLCGSPAPFAPYSPYTQRHPATMDHSLCLVDGALPKHILYAYRNFPFDSNDVRTRWTIVVDRTKANKAHIVVILEMY